LACLGGFHAIVKGTPGFFEGVERNLGVMRPAGDVVVWTIRILDGEAIVLLFAAIDAICGLLKVSVDMAKIRPGGLHRYLPLEQWQVDAFVCDSWTGRSYRST
jgi:hypothetical protein